MKQMLTRKQLVNTLQNRSLSLVIADAGWGKTWLGQQILTNMANKYPCWSHIFHQKAIDEGESFLVQFANFLAEHGRLKLQHYLQRQLYTQQGKQLVWDIELKTILTESLHDFACFLWFDDLQVLYHDSLTEQIVRWLSHNKPNLTHLLLTGRSYPPEWSNLSAVVKLKGLTTTEIQTWFSSDSDLVQYIQEPTRFELIEQETERHPLLLKLFVILVKANHAKFALESFQKSQQATNYLKPSLDDKVNGLLEGIWHHVLDESEHRLLSQVALLLQPEKTNLIQQLKKHAISNIDDIIKRLESFFLLHLSMASMDEEKEVSLFHGVFQEYIRKHISHANFSNYHLEIAHLYEQRASCNDDSLQQLSDWLNAALHYHKSASLEETVHILIDYGDELLYFSRRLEYVDLLQNIDISALSHSTAEQLLEKLGKAGFYLGDYDDDGITLSSYQKLCDSTNNPKWLFYQARVYRYRERKGDHGKAVDILKQVVVQAQQQNHLVLIPQAQLEMGAICVKLNEIPQAIQLIKEGMVFFDIDLQTAENASLENIEHAFDISGISSEHYNSIAWGLRHAGLAYVRQGKANPTIACWYAAKALWEKMEDNLNVAAMHTNLGGAYQLFSISLEKSKYHLQTAQVILEEQQSLYELFRLYNMLTHLYMTKGDFYNALQTSNKILYLTEQGLEVSLGHDLETRGRIYDSIEQWEQAEHFYKESLNYVAPQFRITREIYLADMYLSWGRRLKYNKKHAIDKYYTAKKQFETLLDLAEEKGTSNDDIPRIKLGLAEVLLGIVSLSNNDGDNTVLDDIQTMLEQTQSEFRTISEDRQAEWWFIPARIDRVWAEYHRLQGHFSETESLLENTWDSLLSDMVENGVNKEEIWVLEALVDLERTMKGETHDHNQSAK